jgi:hypothetical protein
MVPDRSRRPESLLDDQPAQLPALRVSVLAGSPGAELITWPLALLALVSPSSFTLLVVQDLALAGCTVVIALFTRDVLVAAPARGSNEGLAHGRPSWWEQIWERGWGPALGVGAIAIAVINPWTYWSASFDFHIQAVATLFALLLARDLWNGRSRRSLWFVAALLLCGNVAGTYLVGVGIFALLSVRRRDLRVPGIALAVGGLAASAIMTALGGAEGTLIGYNYAYLAHVTPGTSSGTGAIVVGMVTHPGTRCTWCGHERTSCISNSRQPASSECCLRLASAWARSCCWRTLSTGHLSSAAQVRPSRAFRSTRS